MKVDETIFQFLEEFLEWNFSRLDNPVLDFICGSPSVALHLCAGLTKMRIPSQVIAIVPAGVCQENDSQRLRAFLQGSSTQLKGVPIHFAVSVEHRRETAMFDARGELLGRDNCIRIGEIHPVSPLLHKWIITACTNGHIDKAVRSTTLENLAINFNRLAEHRRFWTPGKYTAPTGWVPFSSKMDFTGLDDLMDQIGNGIYKKAGKYIKKQDRHGNENSNSHTHTNNSHSNSTVPISGRYKSLTKRKRRDEDNMDGIF